MIVDEKLIQDQADKAAEMDGTYHGMTYEQGIRDALDWVLEYQPAPLDE